MNDDDIAKALAEAEDEVARIEAEIMGPPPPTPSIEPAAAVVRPLSLASLSLQCKSMGLIDVVNISLNTHNLPTTWAQNEARSMMAAPPTSNFPIQSNAGAQHRTVTARAAVRKVSNSWKRCLFEAAGVRTPLAVMWSDALSQCADRASDDSSGMVAVSSGLLQFLPLIDPQLGDNVARDFIVHLSPVDLQVHGSRHKMQCIPQLKCFHCRFSLQPRFLL